MSEDEIIYAMRIAKEKIEELRAQLATNHERAEEIIRAREATITRQSRELEAMRDLLTRADDALDNYGLGSEGSPLRSAIRDTLSLSNKPI